MTETNMPYGSQKNEDLGTSKKFDNGSWSIDFSESEKCFYFQVIDYHASPLRLSVEQIATMAGISEMKKEIVNKTVQSQAESKPQDPIIGINRREKRLYIDVAKGWSGLLTISRKDLYRFGKQMGRRSRINRLKVRKQYGRQSGQTVIDQTVRV